MTDAIHCGNCGKTWTEEALYPVRDLWGRVEPGDVMPLGECPDEACRALCYPPYGSVHTLEHQLTALRHVLTELLAWEQTMGGWEASVWDEARRVLAWSDGDTSHQDEEPHDG